MESWILCDQQYVAVTIAGPFCLGSDNKSITRALRTCAVNRIKDALSWAAAPKILLSDNPVAPQQQPVFEYTLRGLRSWIDLAMNMAEDRVGPTDVFCSRRRRRLHARAMPEIYVSTSRESDHWNVSRLDFDPLAHYCVREGPSHAQEPALEMGFLLTGRRPSAVECLAPST